MMEIIRKISQVRRQEEGQKFMLQFPALVAVLAMAAFLYRCSAY
jgi:hypothetical protein